jgi:integrase
MRLLDLLPDYILERAVGPLAAYQLGRTLRLYGSDRTTADLEPRRVSEWLESLEKRYAKRTVAGHRGNLLAIWRWAAGRGLATMPAGVRRCPRPRPRPVAWTAAEFRRLLEASSRMPDPAFWRLTLSVAYSTGLRRSDLWRLGQDVRPDGTIWLEQHKTGEPHVCRVPVEVAQEWLASSSKRPLCPGDKRRFYDSFAWLCRMAGVRRGALQMCRRTGATACEIRQAGSASKYLGHRTPGMAAYYVDRSQLPGEPIMPPEV